MTVIQKPAALAQPRRRLLWPAATSAEAPPAERSAVPVVAVSAPQAASPCTEPLRRTARKATPHAGSFGAASASAAAATECQPLHQESAVDRDNAIAGLRCMLGQTGHAISKQSSGAAGSVSAGGHCHTPSFDLAAALRHDTSAHTTSLAAQPNQHAELAPLGSAPCAAGGPPSGVRLQMREHADAQRKSSAQQAIAGHGRAPFGAGPNSAFPPAQTIMQSVPAKRAAALGPEPLAKHARRSDGSLLGIANSIITEFARRRLRAMAAPKPMPVCVPC
jgi:hypothetical protein